MHPLTGRGRWALFHGDNLGLRNKSSPSFGNMFYAESMHSWTEHPTTRVVSAGTFLQQ